MPKSPWMASAGCKNKDGDPWPRLVVCMGDSITANDTTQKKIGSAKKASLRLQGYPQTLKNLMTEPTKSDLGKSLPFL